MSFALASELTVDELNDGETILHLPLDDGFESISNSFANASAVLTNLAEGGSVSFQSSEVSGQYVVSSVASGKGHDNGGYVRLDKARIGIDVSQFGIGYDCTSLTIEGYVRGLHPGQMTDWTGLIALVVRDGGGAETIYSLLSPSSTAGQMWMKMVGRETGATVKDMSYGVLGGFDGQWHHFAFAVKQMPAGSWAPNGSHMECYLDHVDKGFNENSTRWHGYSDDGSGKKMYLFLGNTSSTIEIDELRISKGYLGIRDFLRLRSGNAKDGEPVLHLTFDEDSLASSVFTEDQPRVKEGTANYDSDVPSECISEGKAATATCRTNRRSLRMDAAMVQLYLENWMLGRGGLRDLTLEFFIKGSSATRSKDLWGGPFRLSDANNVFPFLLQINGSTNYYFRADAAYWNGTGEESWYNKLDRNTRTDFHDGKWHHVALTVKETANETSRLELFFDHVSIGSLASANHAWRGLGRDGFMGFGHANAGTVWIDEVRVTKGVLKPESFLYARKGLMFILR